MNGILQQKARIGMALALSDYLETPRNGRINNLLGRLRTQCIKRLAYMIGRGNMPIEQEALVRKNMEAFGKATGWEGKAKHAATYTAFLLAMFEKHPEDGIIGALNEISDFLEGGDNSPRACACAGALACEKWEKIWGE